MFKLKKIFLLTMILLICMSTTAVFAVDIEKFYETDMFEDNNYLDITPMLYPGGAAPQVTNIELNDFCLQGDNFFVVIKVTGYGSGNTTFNGVNVNPTTIIPFINYGTIADGFYYTYNCGVVTEPGEYLFKTTFTSNNPPYSRLTFEVNFEFTDN
ncbi:hypothetical protein [Sedimentibacter sp.]|uniref:hypothetical protein n=1 Tax=Sedimentibacter sp. TaxID=1960295 RepID=UPI0028A82BE0|nr:hypothetical protein [Sedimentibacter sp.]